MSTQVVIPEENLPSWMKRARRGFDWGMLLVIGFSILIAWPFIENPSLPRTNDSIHYAFQAHDTAQALLEGRLYPRWSPYALNGIGAPIAHYTPPFPAYVTALTEILFTNNTVIALRVVHIISIVFAGLAVYALVMQRVNGFAGLLAALLYVYSPYLSLTVPHVLGNLPQAIMLALLPMLLWSVNRLLHRNQAIDIFFVAIISTLICLTLPQSILLAMLLSGLLLVLHILDNHRWQSVQATILAQLAGYGFAAFYWLPAYFEHGLVQWLPVSTTPRLELLTINDLFKRTVQLDSGLLRHNPTFNLGWVLVAFVVISIGLIIIRRGTRFQSAFLICGAVLLLISLTLFASSTWLMSGIVLCFAIAGSTLGNQIMTVSHRVVRYIIVCLIMIIILLAALPIWISQSSLATIDGVSPTDQIEYELKSGTIALLPDDAYYPTTIAYPDTPQTIGITSGDAINRVRNVSSAQVTLIEAGSHYARYTVFADEQTSVDYAQAFFKGWFATVDGERIPLVADLNTSLTTLEVPVANNGILTIRLGTTAIRIFAWVLSYTTIAIIIGWVWQRWQTLEETFDDGLLIPIGLVRVILIILAIGIMGRIIPEISNTINTLRHPANYESTPSVQMSNTVTEGNLVFTGYDLSDEAFHAGDTLNLSLYWQAAEESNQLYETSIEVYDTENDVVFYESDKHPPGYYPTGLWATGFVVSDTYSLPLPDDLSTGTHFILIRLWECDIAMICDEPVRFTQSEFAIPIRFEVTDSEVSGQ